ncbi:type 3 dihydrofolate reductase [Aliikangiella sp. IMCC44632]
MSIPKIGLVAAMAKNRIIGKDNQMPWHLPADLKHFKAVTLGKPIIMGRKTYESIGRPLPGRLNIVVSRNSELTIQGCETATSLHDAIAIVAAQHPEVMVIGGGQLYREALPLADKLYLTFIDLETAGDTQFPEFEHLALTEIQRSHHSADEANPYHCEFVDYQINKPAAT